MARWRARWQALARLGGGSRRCRSLRTPGVPRLAGACRSTYNHRLSSRSGPCGLGARSGIEESACSGCAVLPPGATPDRHPDLSDPSEAAFASQRIEFHAHDQPARSPRPRDRDRQVEVAGPAGRPAAPRRLHARLHDDAEEAELGAAQGRQGAPHERLRDHLVHRRRGPQPAGAQRRAGARRPGQGSAGRSLSHRARLARPAGRQGSQAVPFQVRRQAPEEGLTARRGGASVSPSKWAVLMAARGAFRSVSAN
jgi:hypothetical protein